MDTTRPHLRIVEPPGEPRSSVVQPAKKAERARIDVELPERGILMLCPHQADNALTRRMAREANALHARGVPIRFYCRTRPACLKESIQAHEVGEALAGTLVDRSEAFAHAVFLLETNAAPLAHEVVALGSEWAAVPALRLLDARTRLRCILSLTSLESMRSDMTTELSQAIAELEKQGISLADRVLVADDEVAEHAVELDADCSDRLRYAWQPFPASDFASDLDPGEVKARFQVGPVDPTVLFIGDMDWRHGPDILMKAMPALLRNHPGLRAIFVGDGEMLWPTRVQARYMLVEHAVRVVGHLDGQALNELVAAADIVVVPSRERTEDWEVLAAWAARRPVVVAHQVGAQLCTHERDAVLIYPNPGSCVWGVERVLFDPELARDLGERGAATLESRFGWNAVAARISEVAEEIHRSVDGKAEPPEARA